MFCVTQKRRYSPGLNNSTYPWSTISKSKSGPLTLMFQEVIFRILFDSCLDPMAWILSCQHPKIMRVLTQLNMPWVVVIILQETEMQFLTICICDVAYCVVLYCVIKRHVFHHVTSSHDMSCLVRPYHAISSLVMAWSATIQHNMTPHNTSQHTNHTKHHAMQ